jgi:hypothetical protein
MAHSKGIHAHKVFKLGKAAAKKDGRNLKMALLLKRVPVPAAYDFDTRHPGIPTPMFANDTLGCCVISGRAHQTLRFEDIEQKSVLMITDEDVVREYKRETGGPDTGLVVLDSLKLWRKGGWKAAKHSYHIRAFAEIDPGEHDEMRLAIFSDVGVGIGLALPTSAQEEIQTGQPWSETSGPGTQAGSWGGHYVFVCGYNPKGPVCVTWGRKQQMTWAWFGKYCDEAYATFDAKNRFKKAVIDQARITRFLATLTQPVAV